MALPDRAYLDDLFEKELRATGVLSLIGFGLALFAAACCHVAGYAEIVRTLLFVAAPCCLVNYGLTRVPGHRMIMHFTLPILLVGFCFSFENVMIRHLPNYLNAYQTNLQFLFIFIFFAATRVLFPFKLAAGFVVVIALFVQHVWHFGVNPSRLAMLGTAGAVGVFLGGFVAYRMERFAVDAFSREKRIREDNLLSENLLRSILPERVMQRYLAGEGDLQQVHAGAAILFCRLNLRFSEAADDRRRFEILADLYGAFDDVAKELGLEKIKTIGPIYMAAAGLFDESGDALETALEAADRFRAIAANTQGFGIDDLSVTIGVDRGELASGVIGTRQIAFDVWGAPVNRASRLADLAEPGVILVPADVARADGPAFPVELKGIGEIRVLRWRAAS